MLHTTSRPSSATRLPTALTTPSRSTWSARTRSRATARPSSSGSTSASPPRPRDRWRSAASGSRCPRSLATRPPGSKPRCGPVHRRRRNAAATPTAFFAACGPRFRPSLALARAPLPAHPWAAARGNDRRRPRGRGVCCRCARLAALTLTLVRARAHAHARDQAEAHIGGDHGFVEYVRVVDDEARVTASSPSPLPVHTILGDTRRHATPYCGLLHTHTTAWAWTRRRSQKQVTTRRFRHLRGRVLLGSSHNLRVHVCYLLAFAFLPLCD